MSSDENDSDKKNESIGSSYVDVIRRVVTPQCNAVAWTGDVTTPEHDDAISQLARGGVTC